MDRRSCLLGSAKVLAAASTVSYFDIGAAFQRQQNFLLTPEWITREALRMLEKNLQFTKEVHRDYDKGFLAKGDILELEGVYQVNPVTGRQTDQLQQFVVRQPLGPTENELKLLKQHALCHRQCVERMQMTEAEGHLRQIYNIESSIKRRDSSRRRILHPGVQALADDIDRRGLEEYRRQHG